MRKNDEIIKSINKDITPLQLDQLYEYYLLLESASKTMNLTTIVEYTDVYIKHFYDSLLVKEVVTLDNKSIIDVGSGAGFPGLVLAICYPNASFTLVEPTLKRCNFLNKVITELKLENIVVINERAEKLDQKYRESFDIATARAVAQVPILLELLTPYTKVGGKVVILKGINYEDELNQSNNAIKLLSLELDNTYKFMLPRNFGTRNILVFSKTLKTKSIYPRDYAKIKSKPL